MIKATERGMADLRISDIGPSKSHLQQDFSGLLTTLAEIVEKLTKSPESGVLVAGLSDAMWQDGSYCYLELDLAEPLATEVDLNITNGRVYLRIAR